MESRFSIYRSAPGGQVLQLDFKLNLETGLSTARTKIEIPFSEISRFVCQVAGNCFPGPGQTFFTQALTAFQVPEKVISGP